ncbi:MAG: fatty acid desaturase [Myxococcales bacterium]|nr:fatty acid desaturase [Myxococcales bacterium]
MDRLIRWLVGLAAFGRAALRADFVHGLISAQDALGLDAFHRLGVRMACTASGRRLLEERPSLRATLTQDVLERLPVGSLGRTLHQHLLGQGVLSDITLPDSPYAEHADASFAKMRWRETHDLRHVLTGLGVGVPDESLLHAFQLGQHFNPFSLVIVLFGPLYGHREQSPLVTWSRVPEAYRAGRAARLTADYPYEEHLHLPVAEVRRQLAITPLGHLSQRPVVRGSPRRGRDLVRATLPYASEQRARTWWELATSTVPYAAGLFLAVLGPGWPLQLVGSLLLALSTVRLFGFLHDYGHGTILADSRLGGWLVEVIGVLTCVPPRVWRGFHNRHHRTTAMALPEDPTDLRGGDFINRVVHRDAWPRWSRGRRALYRLVRHPITMASGWLTSFVLGACATQFLRDPKRNGDALLTLAGHLTWLVCLGAAFGWDVFWFVGAAPAVIGAAIGTWLIYIQHSFPGVQYQEGPRWNFVDAALKGTSFLDLPSPLRWLTANVGYHHVHHLNPRIPFYRLPEVMAALPELRACTRITLRWRDMWGCLQVQAWDATTQRAAPLPSLSQTP